MANATKLDPINVENGRRLKEARKNCGFTQEELAGMVAEFPNSKRPDCNRNTISRFENGIQPISREYAALFSQIFNVRAEWLLGECKFPTESEENFNEFIECHNEWQNKFLAFNILAHYSGYSFELFKTNENGEVRADIAINAIKRGYEIKHNNEIMGYIPLERFNCMVYSIQEQTELYIKQYLREVSDNGNNNPTNKIKTVL